MDGNIYVSQDQLIGASIQRSIEAYNNKVVTVEVPGVLEAYELIDNIEKEGYSPFMQVFDGGKLLSDNVGPVN